MNVIGVIATGDTADLAVIVIALAVVCGAIGESIAPVGRSTAGFCSGLLLGPVGWVIAARLRSADFATDDGSASSIEALAVDAEQQVIVLSDHEAGPDIAALALSEADRARLSAEFGGAFDAVMAEVKRTLVEELAKIETKKY